MLFGLRQGPWIPAKRGVFERESPWIIKKRGHFYHVLLMIVNLNFNHVVLVGGKSCLKLNTIVPLSLLQHSCIISRHLHGHHCQLGGYSKVNSPCFHTKRGIKSEQKSMERGYFLDQQTSVCSTFGLNCRGRGQSVQILHQIVVKDALDPLLLFYYLTILTSLTKTKTIIV